MICRIYYKFIEEIELVDLEIVIEVDIVFVGYLDGNIFQVELGVCFIKLVFYLSIMFGLELWVIQKVSEFSLNVWSVLWGS